MITFTEACLTKESEWVVCLVENGKLTGLSRYGSTAQEAEDNAKKFAERLTEARCQYTEGKKTKQD
jgi:predicted RNase H-like HicB family nuclease